MVANTTIKIVLETPFLIFSKVKINFAEEEFIWKTYTPNDILPTIKRVQIIDQNKFVTIALDPNKETIVVYVAYLEFKISIHPACKAQIVLLLAQKINVPKEYADFSDVFYKKSAAVLPNCSNISKHTMDLQPGKQPLYRPIYSLNSVTLKTLKTYIKANFANRFIRSSKSPTRESILFI